MLGLVGEALDRTYAEARAAGWVAPQATT
jgi:hypothetical protein